jgi:hypothetical protein
LRCDAAQRKVLRMLADLPLPGLDVAVSVDAHAVHGSMITVNLRGGTASRAAIENAVRQRLDPLVLRHQIAWD